MGKKKRAKEPADPFHIITITIDRATGVWNFDLGDTNPAVAHTYLELVRTQVWDTVPEQGWA